MGPFDIGICQVVDSPVGSHPTDEIGIEFGGLCIPTPFGTAPFPNTDCQ